jgi:hypothetical protein
MSDKPRNRKFPQQKQQSLPWGIPYESVPHRRGGFFGCVLKMTAQEWKRWAA